MGRKSTVESLPDVQRDFVITEVGKRHTDRQISADFEQEFGVPLPKSSLNYWRNKYGNKAAEAFGMQRALVKAYIQDLKEEGVDVESDKYGHIIKNLEDGLLTRLSEFVAEDPIKLLSMRQEDEKLRIKREQIELNREKLVLERQKLLGAAKDPVQQGTELMTELFDYSKDDSEGVLFVKKHTKPFIEFLKTKYAEAEA